MADLQTDFLVSMAVVIAVAAVIVVLFHRLKQPMILGYLVAGTVVAALAKPLVSKSNVTESIRLLASLGIVLITFSIGLEFSFKQLRKIGITVVTAAAIEIILMIVIGFQLGLAFGWTALESTLLGAMLSVASTMIIVRSMKESGGLDNERARLIVGLLVVEDFAAVLILAAVSGLITTGGINTREMTDLVLKMSVFVASAIVFGIAIVPRLVDYVGRQRSNELLVITVLGLCFSMAVFAKWIGFSEAIGAFVMGVIVSESKFAGDVVRRVEPVRDLFGAIFFITVGMLVDLSQFTSIDVIITAAIIAVVFILAKLFASSLSTFICGFGARNSLGAGLGMLAIGEFTLMIVSVAVGPDPSARTDILPHIAMTIYPVILLVTTATALIVPYTIKYTDRATDIFERRVPRSVLVLASYLNLLVRNMRRRSQSSIRISNEMRNSISRLFAYIVVMMTVVLLAVQLAPKLDQYAYLAGGNENILLLLLLAGTFVVIVYGMYGIWNRTIRLIEISTSEAMLTTKSAEHIGYQATSNALKFAFLGFYAIIGFLAVSPFISSIVEQSAVFAAVVLSIIAIAAIALWRSVKTIDAKLSELFEHRGASSGDAGDLAEIEDIITAMEGGKP